MHMLMPPCGTIEPSAMSFEGVFAESAGGCGCAEATYMYMYVYT